MRYPKHSLVLLPLTVGLGCADAKVSDTCSSLSGIHVVGNGTQIDGVSIGRTESSLCADHPTAPGCQQQGMSLNGVLLNGLQSQGLQTQGLQVQGVRLSAVSIDEDLFSGIAADGARLIDLRLDGASLVGVTSDGRRLEGEALRGARLFADADGTSIALDVTSAARDAHDPSIVAYSLAHDGQSICPNGETALFVSGEWDETGAHRASSAADPLISLSCESGVIQKCIRWGYRPWVEGEAMHQTCTRMARADYCGDGVPHTQNGTEIDVFDALGVQSSARVEEFEFEAGWGPAGALCVARTRYHVLDAAGSEVLPSCWNNKPSCSGWTEARDRGAELGNASGFQVQYLCESP